MKIVAVLGSPHRSGNGAMALSTFLEGIKANNNDVISYELCTLNIKNCLGCRKCIENGGKCVIKDDFKEIFENIKTADTVIIESPIYINQVNGITKTFLDRCYPLTNEHHKPRFGKRNLIMICTYAVPIPFIFTGYIRRTAKSLKAMGLISKQNIMINGCTTINHVKTNKKLCCRLFKSGKNIASGIFQN